MNLRQQLNQLENLLTQAQNVLIFLPADPTYDKIAAGLGMYLGLIKQGKLATIASPTPIRVADADLVGVDKIKNSLDGKNMIVSFPYEEGAIENVSYNFDNNKFNLVIEPKTDSLQFKQEEVKFSAGGTQADLIITIGVKNLTDLGLLYQNNQDLFARKDVVNIDHGAGNANFGKLNIANPQLPTVSEIVVLVLKNLKIILDKDIATNLYQGMRQGTSNFDPNAVSALTFEAAALALRSGAQRQAAAAVTSAFPAPAQPRPAKPQPPKTKPPQQAQAQPQAQPSPQPSPADAASPSKSLYKSSTLSPQQDARHSGKVLDKSPPSDWLKPKIFTPDSNGPSSTGTNNS